jgi:hypothetical protein
MFEDFLEALRRQFHAADNQELNMRDVLRKWAARRDWNQLKHNVKTTLLS